MPTNNNKTQALKPININTALCGFYKSSNVVQTINTTIDQYIYALPSIELCDNKRKDITREFDLIHSESDTKITTPVKDFTRAVNLSTADGIVTTHATLKAALFNGIQLNAKYHLVIDELIDFHKTHYFKATFETYQALRNYIDFVDYQTLDDKKGRYRVEIRRHKIDQVKRIIANRENEDALLTAKGVYEFLEYLLSASHDTYVMSNIKTRLDMLTSNNENSYQFQALSALNHYAFDQFESVTILSSLFNWTICYHLMQIFGFKFNDVTHKRQNHHTNKNAQIHYYIDQNYTYTLRKKLDKRGYTLQSYIAAEMLKNTAGREYMYNANTGKSTDSECPRELLASPKGHLVNTVHGHNDKQHITCCLWLCAQYANRDERNVLTAFGVPVYVIDYDRNQLNAYQHAMRTALRDTDSTATVDLHVPDLRTADFFSRLFPHAPSPIKHTMHAAEAITDNVQQESASKKAKDQKTRKRSLRQENEALYRKLNTSKKKISNGKQVSESKAKELISTYEAYQLDQDAFYIHCVETLTRQSKSR